MNVLALLLLLLASGAVRSLTTKCPASFPCGCYQRDNDPNEFRLHCLTDRTSLSSFDLRIRPENLVHIVCRNSPDWADFLFEESITVGPINTIILKGCTAPEYNAIQLLEVNGVQVLRLEDIKGEWTAENLQAFPEVRDLVVTGNNLGNLNPGILTALPHLKKLDLKSTRIKIPTGFFYGAGLITALELGDNNLSTLYPGIFDGLKSIELLNIWKNNLTTLHSKSFRHLTTLLSLDLHMNNLSILPDDIFNDLTNLKVVNLGVNSFTSMPAGLFKNNLKLQTMKIFFNRGNITELPPRFLANLENLKTVSLMRIGLSSLPEDLIWGSTNLAELNLNRNYLSILPDKLLKDAKELVKLELSFNDLKSLPAELFANSKKLVSIDLSKNRLASFSDDLFLGLESLRELNVEHNDLVYINPDAFRSLIELRIAKFSYNQLTSESNFYDFFGHVSPFHKCPALEKLYLSHNNISAMFGDWVINQAHLRKLDLSYNQIEFLEAADLQFLSKAIDVDLSHNQIEYVNLDRLEMIASGQSAGQTVNINLEANPIQCDCDLYSLLRYLNGEMTESALNYANLRVDSIICQDPEYMQGFRLVELRASELRCLVETAEEQPGNPCAPGAECDCWRRPSDQALLIECEKRNLTDAPMWIDARGFVAVDIDLSMNELWQAPTMTRRGYNKVRSLNLAGNKIDRIDESLITPNLQFLNLKNNNLRIIEPTVLDKISNSSSISKLNLSGNPWQCDCESVDLYHFTQTYLQQMPDSVDTYCAGTNYSIRNMTLDEFCPQSIKYVLIPCVAVALFGLVFGGLIALYFIYQQPIKVWLYSKNLCSCLFTEEEIDKDKKYDAFISYSHKDEDFVKKELILQLESGPRPYKLCIHERDWVVGDWIANQIIRSVEQSRRTVVVLSPNFMESIWAKLEFQAAHKKALSEKCTRLIVILYGDIQPNDVVDPDLKAYLQMNTYVKWGDPWFWQKLRYAMPHLRAREEK